MEQEAAESWWLKLSWIPIFSGTFLPSPHLHTCMILSQSFIPPLPESAPKASKQAGYWIQTPKLPPGLISSHVFVKRLCWRSLSKSSWGNGCPHIALFWSRLKWSLKQIPSAIPSVIQRLNSVLLLPRSCTTMLLLDCDHGDYFHFPKQRRQSKEMLQAKFLHTKCSSPKGVMKA